MKMTQDAQEENKLAYLGNLIHYTLVVRVLVYDW